LLVTGLYTQQVLKTVMRAGQTRQKMVDHPVFEFLPVEDFLKEGQTGYYRELAAGDDTGDCRGIRTV